jgi:hypothetical protein
MHDNCPMAVLATRWDRLVRGTCVRGALAAWLMGTCAASPGCRRLGPVDQGPDLQIVGESTRLRTTDPVPATSPWFDGTKVSIAAARGEHIGLQVLHRGGGAVELTFRQPGGASRSADVRQFSVEQFEVHRPSTELYGGSHGPGRYADGIQIALEPPTTDPAFLDIEVLRTATPGVLLGDLKVAGRTIPVELTISPVTLPELPLRVWAYGNPRESTWVPSATSERSCSALFRLFGVLLSPDVHLEDWPAFRDRLSKIHDVPVWISEDPAVAGGQVKQWIEIFAGTGQVPFAIPIDEPRTPEARQKVRALAEVVRAAGGGPTTFRFALTDEPRPEYGDLIDLYISPRAAHLTGDTVARWTYNGAPPRAGAMVLDAEFPGMRTWGWISWRWQIPVWYVWDALYWHDRHNRKGAPLPGKALDPSVDPVSFNDGEDHGNFDGVLALPGCHATLRMAALRRGYQDRALLELAALCDQPATEKLAAELIPRALGDAGDKPSWPGDEAAWEAARKKLIALASCQAPK